MSGERSGEGKHKILYQGLSYLFLLIKSQLTRVRQENDLQHLTYHGYNLKKAAAAAAFRLNSDFRNLWYLKLISLALTMHGIHRHSTSNGTRIEKLNRAISPSKRALKSPPSDIITRPSVILTDDHGQISSFHYWEGVYPLWISFFLYRDIRAFRELLLQLEYFT